MQYDDNDCEASPRRLETFAAAGDETEMAEIDHDYMVEGGTSGPLLIVRLYRSSTIAGGRSHSTEDGRAKLLALWELPL